MSPALLCPDVEMRKRFVSVVTVKKVTTTLSEGVLNMGNALLAPGTATCTVTVANCTSPTDIVLV